MTISTSAAQPLGNVVSAEGPEREGAEILRVIAVGSVRVVNQHVMAMYKANYAEPHEWSRLLPAPAPNEVMRILTKRMAAPSHQVTQAD